MRFYGVPNFNDIARLHNVDHCGFVPILEEDMVGQHQSILVVEDDVDIRSTLAGLLTDEEFSVHAAENGREALDWLDGVDELPTAIILDLSMPVMDGRTFLGVRRHDPALASVPVLVVSAEWDCSDLTKAGDVSGVLRKPVSFENLLAAIETLHMPGG